METPDIGPNPRDEPLRKFGSWRLDDVKPINFACNLLVCLGSRSVCEREN
jgi:hypothetical protein